LLLEYLGFWVNFETVFAADQKDALGVAEMLIMFSIREDEFIIIDGSFDPVGRRKLRHSGLLAIAALLRA